VTDTAVAFRWKDYRHHGKAKVMTLGADEFIRRFLMHTLPDGFHRIRHYGFLANGHRAAQRSSRSVTGCLTRRSPKRPSNKSTTPSRRAAPRAARAAAAS
jgi:Putative transposase